MDPLSGVLSLLKPRNLRSGGFDYGGDWAIQYPRHEGIKCYALVAGECWLAVEGVADPVPLRAGDCFLLPLGRPFRLASDLALPPVDFHALVAAPRVGRVATWNGGGVFGVGGFFALDGDHAALLLGMLPPVVHLRSEAERSALRWAIERMMHELREPQPGGDLVLEHLALLLLIQALRAYLAEGGGGGVGWLAALADPQVGPALEAIHGDPGHSWTLPELAGRVGMSRSGFAAWFRAVVGSAPIDYLTRWRMHLAADRLARTGDPVAVVARALGYESESAFGTAFKRVMGRPPRRSGRAPAPQDGPPREAPASTPGDGATTRPARLGIGG